MSSVRIIINELLSIRQKNNYNQQIKHLSHQAQQLKVHQLQELMHQISQLIYQREETASIQLSVLQLVKMLMISGVFSIYALSHVYIFPWVLSIADFHRAKDENTRAKLFLRETTGKNNENKIILDSFKQLLAFAQQFLIFFGSNLKFYPYSKYKIKNSLARQFAVQQYKKSLTRFTVQDLALMKKNLEEKGETIRQQFGIFADFLNSKLQECFDNPNNMHDNIFLLKSLAEMGESYCINCITFQLKSYFLPQKALNACKIANLLISTAQIETLQSVNIRCLPRLLECLLPIDFRDNRVLSRPKQLFIQQDLNMLIDYYYLWFQKTKMLKLSIKIYQNSFSLVEYLKKPYKIGYQSQLQQFQNNIQKIYSNNQLKQTFIIDQHSQEQQSIVSLLKQLSFCLNSQRAQRQIAYQNVLDDLTITEEDSRGHISQFSKSLLKSAQDREQQQQINKVKGGKSPKSSSVSSKKYSAVIHGKNTFEKKENIENIYYYKSAIPDKTQQYRNRNSLSRKQLNSPMNKPRLFRNYEIQHEAEEIVSDPSLPKVTSNNSRGRQSAKSSSKSNDISIHSSQFSQKENNLQRKQNRHIQSIYMDKSDMVEGNKDKSGQFLYFEKQSQLNSQRQIKNDEENSVPEEIQFSDSLKHINNSQSSQILQFGMDPHARVPQTVGKPKFNFKAKQKEESSPNDKYVSTPKKQPPSNVKSKASQQYYAQKIIEPSSLNEKEPSIYHQAKFSKVKIFESERQSRGNQASKINYFKDQQSSIIKENSQVPHMISESISLSTDKIPSNFSKVFREKEEKASVLSSSRSLRGLRKIPEKKVEIPDFKKLRDLQNELGQLKKQAKQVAAQLQQKNHELKKIEIQKLVNQDQDPYYLKKQNEIMKILLKNKDKGQRQQKKDKKDMFQQSAKSLTKQLKESSIKNYNISLKDYKGDLLKIKFSNIKPYLPEMKKNIVANRCILAKDQMVEVGYSYKNGCVTLYLTLNSYCQSLSIRLEEGSISFSENIDRSFDKLLVGKQMKFKTFTVETKENDNFENPKVLIQLFYQHKNQQKKLNYECQLPLTPYNMAKPLSQIEGNSVESRFRSQMTPYITPLYNSCDDLFKKGKASLLKVFPHGLFNEKGDVFSIYYEWKEKIQQINIKLKQKAFRIQGNGYPLETGRQLIEAIINILSI